MFSVQAGNSLTDVLRVVSVLWLSVYCGCQCIVVVSVFWLSVYCGCKMHMNWATASWVALCN